MLVEPLRGLTLAALLCAGCGAAEADGDVEAGRRYDADAAWRRAVLEGALVNPGNGYSRLRLQRYTEDRWGALPVWQEAAWPEVPWRRDALLDLGRRAFFAYPVQVSASLAWGGDGYGLHHVVTATVPRGDLPALTCASCHARDGVAGPSNYGLDYGRLLDDWHRTQTAAGAWGPGRIDVTADGIDNPTAIGDLRPVALQTHLHRTASVRNGLVELAIRTETLIITSLGEAARPARQVAFALALFVWSLADDLPPVPAGDDHPGRAVLDAQCGHCHFGPDLTGPPRLVETLADPDPVFTSPERTTGMARVPSLRGLSSPCRRPLLADGASPDLATLLSAHPATPGRFVGLELPEAERAALLDLFQAL